ncbi:MAG: arginine repressor [Gemmatimonadota bacterium]|nr:arginine repressor [Gemmatimonadota bacterium]
MKLARQSAILDLVRTRRVPSQEALREMLVESGFDVAQATLSRDVRELGLAKIPDERGGSVYTVSTPMTDPSPVLARLLPALLLGVDGVGNLLLVRTLAGGAQPVAVAIDGARWPEVVGTIAGDDAILVILRSARQRAEVARRIQSITERDIVAPRVNNFPV